MSRPKVMRPKHIRNKFYYFIGAVVVILNYFRQSILGYKSRDGSIDYDFGVVDGWIKYLPKCIKEEESILENKVVLELGPGPDLGIGLILLAMGVKKYIALDVCALAQSTTREFYEKLLKALKRRVPDSDINYLREQLDKCYKKEDSRITYIVDRNFEISKIRDEIDIVFSQAAFQYFLNTEKTFRELSSIVKSGGVLVSEIDLKTHVALVRNRDPLNIYRYNNFFWNFFKTKYSLNRVRAFEYKELLEKNGWFDVEIEALAVLDEEYLKKVKPSLNRKFSELDTSEMKMLSIMLMAKKK